MKVESLTNATLKYSVNNKGMFYIYNNDKQVFNCSLMPFDSNFEQPFSYQLIKLHPLNVPPLAPENRSKPLNDYWQITKINETIEAVRYLGDLEMKQTFKIEDQAIVIESFIKKPKHCELPVTFNIFKLFEDSKWGNSVALISGSTMGHYAVKPLKEYIDGNKSKNFMAVQSDDYAVMLNSEIGSGMPISLSKHNGEWHGYVQTAPVPKDENIYLGRLEIRFGSCAQTMLEEFASRTAAPKLKKSMKCWNSWDYYHSSISYDKIMENTKALASDPILKDNVDTIVMDMGWEVRFGEWIADPNFQPSMQKIADDIIASGFKAGLWLAPIIIDPECNFFQDDYSWVGSSRFGLPDRVYECCGLFGYVLDVTTDKGEKYLYDVFKGFKEMGYSYFKLDFLRYMMFVDRYGDLSVTNTQVMQKALKIIREAVGDDAYILGCNLPNEVGPGYVDSARVSSDVSIFWNGIKKNAASICSSYYLNNKWWVNDPDFLVVRGNDTFVEDKYLYKTWWIPTKEVCMENPQVVPNISSRLNRHATLSLEEARTHASLEMMLGGALILADPSMYLNQKGLELIRKVMSTETAPGRPVDIFKHNGLAQIWVQKISNKTRVAIFNWEDYEKNIELDFEYIGVEVSAKIINDFWTGESINVNKSKQSFQLQPHSCKVLEIN